MVERGMERAKGGLQGSIGKRRREERVGENGEGEEEREIVKVEEGKVVYREKTVCK